jgi:hypothetical protein
MTECPQYAFAYDIKQQACRLCRLSMAVIATIAMTNINSSWADTYYRWVDDNNVTHYTTRPPAGRETVVVNTKTGGHSALPTEKNGTKETSSAQKTQQQQKQSICETAKSNLETLKSKAQVRLTDEYGEQRLMSKEDKEKEVARAKEAIKLNCQP